jgi:hypothetical protein
VEAACGLTERDPVTEQVEQPTLLSVEHHPAVVGEAMLHAPDSPQVITELFGQRLGLDLGEDPAPDTAASTARLTTTAPSTRPLNTVASATNGARRSQPTRSVQPRRVRSSVASASASAPPTISSGAVIRPRPP